MTSTETYAAGVALIEAAAVEAKVERCMSEARVAKLRAAAELERAGRYDEAAEIVAAVREEQEAIR